MDRARVSKALTLALLLYAIAGRAQVELPDFVKQTLQAGNTYGNSAQLMVTNEEFKQFRPTHEFDLRYAARPAAMTEREASDYAAYVGKQIGKDLYWQEVPQNESTPVKKTGIGYLINVAPGLNIDLSQSKPFVPTPPPGMVYVPEGPFIMGSDVGDPDETPQQKAATSPYFIDKSEVRNAEFKRWFPDFAFAPGQEDCPAIVTWEQAAAFAEKVEKRLPTEAEWEKAARGMDGRLYPWGNTFEPSAIVGEGACDKDNTAKRPESPYGCVDMAGSAWEWTADWYNAYKDSEAPNDDYGEKYKVIRGGTSLTDISTLRASHRYYLPPKTTGKMRVSFRCAKSL